MAPANPCPLATLTARLASGGVSPDDRDAAERHLTACPDCAEQHRRAAAGRFPDIPGYLVLRELGRGGFGVVYKAYHADMARFEALKVLSSASRIRTAFFQNEVRLAASLRHPNIVTLYAARLDPPPAYFAMEYVDGARFDDFIRESRVSVETRLRALRTIVRAVACAHEAGVIHRDLKPQNILVDARGEPRIVDFGIAKRIDPGARAGADHEIHAGVLGTYGYVAPEQAARQEIDHRADIYSLGVLIYHTVTGLPPHTALAPDAVAAAFYRRRLARYEDLAAIVDRCVAAAVERRYATAAALADDLDRYVSGRPVAARRPVSAVDRARRLASYLMRNHAAAVAAALLLCSAAVLLVLLELGGARYSAPAADGDAVALVAITPETVQAIETKWSAKLPGLEPRVRKSWRVLYGAFMSRLAAAHPRAVVWDIFFPDAQPLYDQAFAAGARALLAPVVVASDTIDVNADPAISSAIHAAIDAWGTIFAVDPAAIPGEFEAPLAITRGLNPPAPSLILSAYAAARAPDSRPEISVAESRLRLRYRLLDAPAGASRWRPGVDEIHLFRSEQAGKRHALLTAMDHAHVARFSTAGVAAWRDRAIGLERVMDATDAELRDWFGGRVILVGQMIAPADQHTLRDGPRVFGCQLQAAAIDALLADVHTVRLSRPGLGVRVLAGLAAGVLLAAAIGRRRAAAAAGGEGAAPQRFGPTSAGVVIIAGLVLAVAGAAPQAPLVLELLIAGSGAAIGLGVVRLVQHAHAREYELGPSPAAAGPPGAATTVLAAAPGSGSPESTPSDPPSGRR